MAVRRKYRVCFTVGSSVPWEKAVLFGNMIAEPPIVRDYLAKTNGNLLPTGPADPERDWWDEGPLTERAASYRSILAARKHGLRAAALDELAKGKMPDLLTYRGFTPAELKAGAQGRGSRHEFYEIKPRSLSGEVKGMEKVVWLKRAYANKGLPYVGGVTYPRHFYQPHGVAELPMLMMDNLHLTEWKKALAIIKRRANLDKAELVLEVRPSRTAEGLLLYRICVKLESNEEDDRKDESVIRSARALVNAFVMCAVASKPKALAREMGAVARALEPATVGGPTRSTETFGVWRPPPVHYPLLDIQMVSGPAVLQPRLLAVRDAMNSRGMALPGDRLMLCCDEAFWQIVIQPAPTQLIHYLRQSPARWAEYARDRSGVGFRDAVQEATEIYDFASAAGVATFKQLVDWAAKNPGEAVLIGVAVIAVSALALWALPALAVELAALEAATLAASSGAMSTTFIETAMVSAAIMEEATVLELATAANVSLDAAVLSAAEAAVVSALEAEAAAIAAATAVPVGTAESVVVASAQRALLGQAGSAIGRRVIQEAVKWAPAAAGGGVGLTVMLASRTALASPPGRVRGGPVPPPEAFSQVVGSDVCRLFAVPLETELPAFPGGSPTRRPPRMGETIDAAKFSPEAAKQLAASNQTELRCRYVGELLVK